MCAKGNQPRAIGIMPQIETSCIYLKFQQNSKNVGKRNGSNVIKNPSNEG